MQRWTEAVIDDRGPASVDASGIAAAVASGLLRQNKTLPSWLLYDAEGSRLFEDITTLPEYYPCRTELGILASHADAIVETASDGKRDRLTVAELGAGTASKSQLLLDAVLRRQKGVSYLPSDVSASALEAATRRLARERPAVSTWPIVAHHERALRWFRHVRDRQLLLFLGSSIGNYADEEATRLLRLMRRSLRQGAALLLGTDLRKDPEVLVAAYDDSRGVTAAFNKNVLTRINRELGGRFDLERFEHVALWNAGASRMEMHLQSLVDQVVAIPGLGINVPFRQGERIHTESSVKYDEEMVDRLLGATGFVREWSFLDPERLFALHVARAAWHDSRPR
jgi:dimethylhistidine N-methyltransferase